MKARQCIHLLMGISIFTALWSSSSGAGQSPAPTNQAPFPIIPMIVEYEYAPQSFMQWINDHPQYSMIEAQISKGDPPIYQVVLTEKGSRRRVYYCNLESKVKALQGTGREARLAKIDFRATTNVGEQPTCGFGFSDERGQAIRWRFILASEVSERGAGLTPLAGTSGLLLLYRNRGTLAGAGTAVQIGDKVSEAEPWPEASAPPYFVAYRGSYVEGLESGMLLPGMESWRVTSAPSELREGAEWKLTDDRKRTRQLRITARRGDELTIEEVGARGADAAALSLNVRATPKGLALRSVLLTRSDNLMRISFKPDLDLSTISSGSGSAEFAFQVDLSRHEKVAQGIISAEKRGGAIHLRWQPKSPDWAKAQVLNVTVTTEAAGYKVEAR